MGIPDTTLTGRNLSRCENRAKLSEWSITSNNNDPHIISKRKTAEAARDVSEDVPQIPAEMCSG